jgi:hypothetical protein
MMFDVLILDRETEAKLAADVAFPGLTNPSID